MNKSMLTGTVLGIAVATTVGAIAGYRMLSGPEVAEALGAARDQYDRIFIGGYVTAGGSPQTWLVQISP